MRFVIQRVLESEVKVRWREPWENWERIYGFDRSQQ